MFMNEYYHINTIKDEWATHQYTVFGSLYAVDSRII